MICRIIYVNELDKFCLLKRDAATAIHENGKYKRRYILSDQCLLIKEYSSFIGLQRIHY